MLHRFVLFRFADELVEQVLTFCEFRETPPAANLDFIVPGKLSRTLALASRGCTGGTDTLLTQDEVSESAAMALVMTLTAAPRFVLQMLTQANDQIKDARFRSLPSFRIRARHGGWRRCSTAKPKRPCAKTITGNEMLVLAASGPLKTGRLSEYERFHQHTGDTDMMTRRLPLTALLLFLTLGWLCTAQTAAQSNPSLVVLLNAPNYDAAQNSYEVSVSVNSPQLVYRLIVSVEDAEAGTLVVPRFEVNLGGFSSRQFTLDGRLFQAERKYLLKIQAVDETGSLIRREEDGPSNNPEQQYILASKEFTHQPREAPKFEFAIESVNADYEMDRLVIVLSAPTTHQILKYDGFVVDETGQRVADLTEELYPGPTVVVPMPQALREAQQERKYKVTLNLYTRDDQRAQTIYEFALAPPPKPGLIQRILNALAEKPVILLLIVVVLAVVATVIILFTKKTSTGLPPLERPPIDYTQMYTGRATAVASGCASCRRRPGRRKNAHGVPLLHWP